MTLENKGLILDLTDGTSMVVSWPERLRGRTNIETERHPTRYRNASINNLVSISDEVDLELELLENISPAFDVMIPLRWLQTRQFPMIIPGVGVTMPPARLAFFGTQLIPIGSEWEIVGGIQWEQMGALSGLEGLPKGLKVTFTVNRVDELPNKLIY